MTTLFQDPVIGQPDASSVLQTPGQSAPGLGISSPNVVQDAMQARVKAMPVDQRIFSGLGEVGAALKGDPSPMAVQDQTDQKTRMNNLKILQDTTQALQDGYKTLQGLQGTDRTAFADSWGASLDQTKPGMGNLFKAYAKNPSILDTLEKYATQLPASIQQRIRTDPYGAIDWAYSPAGQTVINTVAEAPMLKDATQRGTFLINHLSQVVSPETAALIHHDGPLTTADFIKINDDVKNHPEHSKLAIPDEVMSRIGDNPKFLSALNLLDSKGQQDVLKKQAEEGLSPTAFQKDSSAYQKMVDAGKGNSPEALRLKANLDRRDAPTSVMLNANGGSSLTPEAVHDQAMMALYDRTSLNGVRDKETRNAVNNEMTKIMHQTGVSAQDVLSGRAGYKADAASLAKITPMADAVQAFSNTTLKVGDKLLELADKADKTGVPLLERALRPGAQSLGDSDVNNLLAQLQIYRTDVARVLTTQNLTGVLSDTARKEVEEFTHGSISPTQVRSLIPLIKYDFDNRNMANQDQMNAIHARLKGGSAPTVPAATTPSSGGAKFLGFEK